MTTSLHRRPFLTPIWLLACFWIVSAIVLTLAAWLLITADSTEIIVVRHAESGPPTRADAPLTAEGEARAKLLAHMLGARQPGRLDAIYVSPLLRDGATAAPLAAELGLTPTVASDAEPRRLAGRALREHRGGRILLIGSLEAVQSIVAQLSGAGSVAALAPSDYGTMYIITVPRIGRANVLSLRY